MGWKPSAERRKVATVLEKHEEMLPSTKRNFAADRKLGKCRDTRLCRYAENKGEDEQFIKDLDIVVIGNCYS